jgi:hypothetical protein
MTKNKKKSKFNQNSKKIKRKAKKPAVIFTKLIMPKIVQENGNMEMLAVMMIKVQKRRKKQKNDKLFLLLFFCCYCKKNINVNQTILNVDHHPK